MIFTDQMNRRCVLDKKPGRIVSLVPSQSELLWDLGLQNELAGITKFCIHPEEMFRSVQRIGGTKQLNLEAIRSLKPDLIIGNKEENDKDQIALLEKEFPVWMSDIYNLGDALNMIRMVGTICAKEAQGECLADSIRQSFNELRSVQAAQKPGAVYLIWKDPYMAAGTQSFIHDMIEQAGFQNLIREPRYPDLQLQELRRLNPEYLLLSSEPYPFREEHVEFFRKEIPDTKTIIVDGEYFSWYGSRMKQAPAYFKSLPPLQHLL